LEEVNNHQEIIIGQDVEFKKEYVLKILSEGEFRIKQTVKTIHSCKQNLYWRHNFKTYTLNFDLDIAIEGNYLFDIESFGMIENFEKTLSRPNRCRMKYKGLVLPSDGYILIIKPNS
jgi:hypothetical protein